MEEGVLPLALVRGHRPKEKLGGPVGSFKILLHLGGSYQTLPGSMGMKKINPAQYFDRGREVSRPQVRKAGRALEIIAQDRDSTPDSEVCVMIFFSPPFNSFNLLYTRWKEKRLEKRKPAALDKRLRSMTNLAQANLPEFFTLTKLSTLTCPWIKLRRYSPS